MFRVKLDNEHEILAHTAGKMKTPDPGSGGRSCERRNDPLRLTKGRITFRFK